MSRRKVTVNWDLIDELLMLDIPASAVAAKIGIHYNTLVQCFKRDKRNILKDPETDQKIHKFDTFSEYISYKKQAGINELLRVAYEEATLNRDKTLLIFLLKNRAGYSDKKETHHSGQVSVYPNLEITGTDDDAKNV